MSEWISVDELIEFCDTERSMLNAHNGGNSVACAALRRVVDFVKEYAVETEPNKSWVSVNDRLPDEDDDVLVWFEYYRYGRYDCLYQTYGIGTRLGHFKSKSWLINGETGWRELRVIAWMPLPKPPKGDDEE